VRAKEEAEAEKLKKDALLLQEAGCFAIVLEKIPASLAKEVSSSLLIPTIGIGAGNGTAGQVLVMPDMLGVNLGKTPKFVRNFLKDHHSIQDAFAAYVAAVKDGSFPDNTQHAW
jgi:3-methyl-2-oxobutanoate hydroxymethyltransferase